MPSDYPLFSTAVIGSMPRPQYVKDLLAARTAAGANVSAELQQRTDDAVRFVIDLQQQAGINVVSDGEWRRETYVDVIADLLDGFEWIDRELFGYHQVVTGELRARDSGIVAREAQFLKDNTDGLTKVALPSPYLIGQRMWEPEQSQGVYPTREAFCEQLVPVLREELLAIRDVGVDIIQLDEPHLCVLVDPEVRATFADPDDEMRKAVEWINAIVEGVDGVRLAVHLCRRNWAREGWGAAGGYEAILDAIRQLKVDQLMMEFSIPVAGDVAVLKEMPEHTLIGLGCIDVRFEQIDQPETVVQRVEKALEYVAADRLMLTPDCGFSPGKDHGIPLDEAYQKLCSLGAAGQIMRDRAAGPLS
jgi:5-methyltetrahydropteroyltriglutamate--homocysteine methyltransferase